MPSFESAPETTFEPHAARWRTSSYSGGVNSECVETAPAGDLVGVRDSKNRAGGHVTVRRPAWRAFVAAWSAADR